MPQPPRRVGIRSEVSAPNGEPGSNHHRGVIASDLVTINMVEPISLIRQLPTRPSVRASASLYLSEDQPNGHKLERILLSVGLTTDAPTDIAESMGAVKGKPLLLRSRLMLADGVPVRVAHSYFPSEPFADSDLGRNSFVSPNLQRPILELGFTFGRSVEVLKAGPVGPEWSGSLCVASAEPAVRIVRTSYSDLDDPIHTLETICVARYHEFHVAAPEADDEF